jgi:hypothetical protein
MDIFEQLEVLVANDNLDEAIIITEKELSKLPSSDFQKMIGRNFLTLSRDLFGFIHDFHVFAKSKLKVKAFYSEMNGFAVNNDLWFIDIFAFSSLGDIENYDWLADYDLTFDDKLFINGLEDIQAAYKDYMENEKWNDDNFEKSSELCEALIILRLQEVFRNVYRHAANDKISWAKIPHFVTAHDSDIIYITRK